VGFVGEWESAKRPLRAIDYLKYVVLVLLPLSCLYFFISVGFTGDESENKEDTELSQ